MSSEQNVSSNDVFDEPKLPKITKPSLKRIKSSLKRHGFFEAVQICSTLQGSIWSSTHPDTEYAEKVIIKATNKKLHEHSMIIINNKKFKVEENIFKERAILKYLTTKKDSPQSIVKYMDWFEDEEYFYLVMEHGGGSLFDFTVKVHEYLEIGKIAISEWHKLVHLLFNQMVDAVEYMHSKNVSNFDVSLENMLISDVDVYVNSDDEKIKFVMDDSSNPIQLKLCDLGLAEMYKNGKNGKCSFLTSKHCGKPNYRSPESIAKKKRFSAQSNDIWCLGVTLFMMIVGGGPWKMAEKNNKHFRLIMNGKMMEIISKWNRTDYITEDLVDLLSKIFKYENERISISDLRQHPWMNKKW